MSPRSLTAPTSSLNYYVSPPLHDQTDGFDGMMLTVNFPFLDDIKNGVKFKHVVSCRESLRLTSATVCAFSASAFVAAAVLFVPLLCSRGYAEVSYPPLFFRAADPA